jgi:hypothetical protein
MMPIKQRNPLSISMFLMLSLLLLSMPPVSHAQSAGSCGAAGSPSNTITLDGRFLDWMGQPCVPDPVGDCSSSQADLVGFFFMFSPNNSTSYFMAQTAAIVQTLTLRLQIDTNNDGVYTSAVDRIVEMRYQPTQNGSKVEIDLLDGRREKVAELARGEDWGASLAEGGNQVEWGVNLTQLGIPVGQPIRMQLQSQAGNGNSWCDTTPEVQWSPADALGWGLLLVILLGVAGLAAWKRTRQV